MERKRKEKEEKVSFGDTFKPPSSSTGQRQTDEEVAIGLFSLTQSKMKTLQQASIIDSENHSSSKLLTLNCKQTLLDTEPFLLPYNSFFLEQQAHFLLQVVARVNQVVASVQVLVAQGVQRSPLNNIICYPVDQYCGNQLRYLESKHRQGCRF